MQLSSSTSTLLSARAGSHKSLSTRIKSMSLFHGKTHDSVAAKSSRFSIEHMSGIQITQFLASLGSQSHHFGFEARPSEGPSGTQRGIPCSLLPLRDLRTLQDKIAVVLQRDLYEHCFVPLAYLFDSERKSADACSEDSDHFSSTVAYEENDGRVWLASVIIEYVRSLLVRFIRIESFIYELLAWLLVRAKSTTTFTNSSSTTSSKIRKTFQPYLVRMEERTLLYGKAASICCLAFL